MTEDYISNLVYRPPEDQKEQVCTFGVKFCQDTFIHESFVKQHSIFLLPDEYYEDTPMGRCIRIKKDSQSQS